MREDSPPARTSGGPTGRRPARRASSAIFTSEKRKPSSRSKVKASSCACLDDREPARRGRARLSRPARGHLPARGTGSRPPASAYQNHVPRRSPVIQPASRNTLRWCETVGWLTSQHAVKSQAQTSGSRSAGAGSRAGSGRRRPGGGGHPGRSGASCRPTVLTDAISSSINTATPTGRSEDHPAMTTETIHETVREHYADAAVRASQGTSCCSDPETIGATSTPRWSATSCPTPPSWRRSAAAIRPPSRTSIRASASSTSAPAAASTCSCRRSGSGRPAAPSGST